MRNDSPVLILANREGKAWNFANRVYNKLADHKDSRRKYLLMDFKMGFYPDKELYVEIKDSVRGHEVYVVHDSTLHPQDWKESLLQCNDALRIADAAKINNVLPYMCYSRQDRPTQRNSISAALLGDNIIDSGATRVLTTDLHNPALRGVYRKISFENLKAAYSVLVDHIKKEESGFLENACVVPPDEGSVKRTRGIGKRLGLGPVYIDKERDENDEIVGMKIIGEIKGKNALIVDDMTSTGGTLCEAAKILRDNGANSVYALTTHGVLSPDKEGRSAQEKIEESELEKLIITDSIPQESRGKIQVVSIANFMGEVIKRITHGESISKIYEL